MLFRQIFKVKISFFYYAFLAASLAVVAALPCFVCTDIVRI